jgi:dihydroneopterin aldolase
MGVVALSNMQVHGRIGVLREENAAGRWFSVSIRIHFPLKAAAQSDNVKDTVDYSKVAEVVHNAMTKKHKLMETASRAFAEGILAIYPKIEKMEILIRKMHPFIQGQVEAAEITWNYPEDY